MLSDLFNYSVFPIFLLILAYSIISAPKFSGKLWSKITKLSLFILAIVYTFNISAQMHSKSFYLKTIQHVTQVESVTKYLEQLLDEGKAEQVKVILKKFNKGYSNSYDNPAEFKIFINSLIEHSNLPANQSVNRTVRPGRLFQRLRVACLWQVLPVAG